MIEQDYHVPPSMCPSCGFVHDGAANFTGEGMPEEGDVGMCFECGSLCVYTADLQRRIPTNKEMAEMHEDHKLMEMVAGYWTFRGMFTDWRNRIMGGQQ